MDISIIAEIAARAVAQTTAGVGEDAFKALASLVRRRLQTDPDSAPIVEELDAEPTNPENEERLRGALLDVMVMDEVFAGKVVRLVGQSIARTSSGAGDEGERSTPHTNGRADGGDSDALGSSSHLKTGEPVRGFPGLTVAATSPQTTAGSDFSIFVLVQNPFDVPITIHNVQTHIPVELLDVNQYRLAISKLADQGGSSARKLWNRLRSRMEAWKAHRGVAVAVGTEFSPESGELFKNEMSVQRDLNIGAGGTASFSAVSFIIPPGVTSENLDAMMRRAHDYQRGVVPICLQPGDSVVRQFVLRTRSKLLFRPLSHAFQIQVNYSVDGVDHTGTVPYQMTIQAALGSIAWGAALGACLGGLLKGLSAPHESLDGRSRLLSVVQGAGLAIMAALGVVIAFARKASVQPIVSVEDFWGGFVIGFSVGYFGFDRFLTLFPNGSGSAG